RAIEDEPSAAPAAGAVPSNTAPSTGPAPNDTARAAQAPPVSEKAPGPQLSAISELNGQKVAIVNGRLVREGDSYGGVHVLRIGVGEVEVGGRRFVLTF